MQIIFLDTESTGLDPRARLIQLAYKNQSTGELVNELFNPGIKIPFEAMAVHHITQAMVADKPAFAESAAFPALKALLAENILVAHNAPFDIMILNNEGVTVPHFIDTVRVAQHVLKSPSYQLQYLRYSLDLQAEGKAHDALGDITVLEAFFNHLVATIRLEQGILTEDDIIAKMIELSTQPVELERFTFGKYNARTFAEIAQADNGYLQWLFNSETQKPEAEQNANLVYTLKKFLA